MSAYRMRIRLVNFIGFGLIFSYFVGGEVSTFKPFIRSRYSVRRPQTTSSTVVTELTTENPGDIKYKDNTNSYNLSQIPSAPITNAAIIKSDQRIIGKPQVIDIASAISGEGAHVIHNTQTGRVTPQSKQTAVVGDFKGKTSTLSPDYDYYDNGENDESEARTLKV